jgi:RNA polymerase subunit RPABC4/transcription elongation factor Spt4
MQFPPELLNTIGVVLEIVVAVTTALLVAFWVGLAVWTLRDIRSRTRDIFAWILATLLVLITGPIGLLLYLLLRPREMLAEVYDRQLEEEALLRDITARRACPNCQAVTESEWLICPHCETELRRKCDSCERPLELDWVLCPHCTTRVPDEANLTFARPASAADATAETVTPKVATAPVFAAIGDAMSRFRPPSDAPPASDSSPASDPDLAADVVEQKLPTTSMLDQEDTD